MKAFKAVLKWLGILLAILFVAALMDRQSDVIKAALGLAVFIGYLAYELHGRLVAIEEHLLRIRAGNWQD